MGKLHTIIKPNVVVYAPSFLKKPASFKFYCSMPKKVKKLPIHIKWMKIKGNQANINELHLSLQSASLEQHQAYIALGN